MSLLQVKNLGVSFATHDGVVNAVNGVNFELDRGQTLGIVGMGRIGQAVARRAAGFSMPVIYHSRTSLKKSLEKALRATSVSFTTLLQEADFISLHVPLSPETTHLIGKREFSWMKKTAILINTSRGPVVDEKELLIALQKGRIAGAGIDVYENEPAITAGLEMMPQAVLLPHVGSATLETRTRMAQLAAENLRAGLLGQRPPHLVNLQAFNKNKESC